MNILYAMLAGLVACACSSHADPPAAGSTAGEAFEIRQSYETETKSDDGGSGSSSGHSTIIERVVAVRGNGIELEYDVPADATALDRERQWQFPVRVFRPLDGAPQLLNAPVLEARIDEWLKRGGLTREDCGKWIFTWNAFEIECDPQSAIELLEPFNLRLANLREGALYRAPGAREAVRLKLASGRSPSTYIAEMEVDPVAVRKERADADVVVAQIMGEPISKEAAMRARAGETVSGTITVTLDADSDGRIFRRTTRTRLITKDAKGQSETESKTEKVERKPVSSSAR